MAYKTSILNDCYTSGCRSRGSYRVFTCWNSSIGDFCKQHADRRVLDLAREELARAAVLALEDEEKGANRA